MTPILPATDDTIRKAAGRLRDGGLVAFPTETVYGLGADATNDKAVAKIFEAKGRPQFNPLIVHYANRADMDDAVVFNDKAELLASLFWPGPLTLILPRTLPLSRRMPGEGGAQPKAGRERACPAHSAALENMHMSGSVLALSPTLSQHALGEGEENLSLLCSAGLQTLAVRIPSHPVARALIKALGKPIAAPSANASGTLSPTTPQHVFDSLGDKAGMILAGGKTEVGLESTVVDLTGSVPALLRPGAITIEELRQHLGEVGVHTEPVGESPKSPGQLLKHYAPATPLRLRAVDVRPGEALLAFGSTRFMGVTGGGHAGDLPADMILNLSENGDLHEAAANLFSMLHRLDGGGFAAIAVMDIPEAGLGLAINDRLKRAAGAQNIS